MGTFYQPGEQRAEKVRALFARIARRYDLINDLQSFGLHRGWKRQVVSLAAVGPGMNALDVCCGTGDIARMLAQSGAQVTGLDFSAEMLAVARGRPALGSGNGNPGGPEYVQGDAQQLPFPEGEFDAVTMGYGLRNLADWERGLSEMIRVANPGGRVLVLDFGKPDNRVWRGAYYAYLKLFVPLLGLVFCGSAGAYAYILESLRNYPAQHGVAARMKELGLAEVGIENLLGGVMTINRGVKPHAAPGGPGKIRMAGRVGIGQD